MKSSSPCELWYLLLLVVVQSFHHVWFFVTTWTASCQASLSFTVSWRFLKLMSIQSVMPPNHLILCRLLLLLPQSLPTSGSFPMSQHFTSGVQRIGASASISTLSMSIQGWFPWGLTGLISFLSKDSQESSPTPQFKSMDSLALTLHYGPTLTCVQD